MFFLFVQWCENHKDCERLRLIDLLVMPWQRLTKYSLLIKAILKKTDNEMHREALKRMVSSNLFKKFSFNLLKTFYFFRISAWTAL